ncbi:hypothetical protein B0H19DRAFT_1245452 [Mycena capillaripes]|nr:hypothetical protein B0H19DRAFT_1245452 [Mycena capillaripes]
MDGHPIHSRDTLFLILKSKPSLFRDTVRNLLILWVWNSDDAKTVLSGCRRVENLWINPMHTDPDLMSLIEDLPLKRLHCSLEELFDSPARIDFTHRLFVGITHLELFDHLQPNSEHYCDLAALYHLSHLSFSDVGFISIAPKLLQTCESLRVLVFFGLGACEDALRDYGQKHELVMDPRFVVTNFEGEVRDWQMGAHTGIDYWSRAEDLVAKRRSGKVDGEPSSPRSIDPVTGFLFI